MEKVTVEFRRQRLFEYLWGNPDTSWRDVRRFGYRQDVEVLYGSLNTAKEHAQRAKRVYDYLQGHPDALKRELSRDLRNDLRAAYGDNMESARISAGLICATDMSGVEAANILNVTKQRVSDLVSEGKLSGVRFGSHLYILPESVENRKRLLGLD